ncbi:hypothetical protein LXH09_37215 [Streptomyces sp. CS7]|uniref:hypothetical protein n=1 Tax=Streptomyces sp. CS-7 TaxID=2906769 RepID=UPI0021B3343E|nr:hypothetical protein [Streptomyces sp. CS-7]MCT6782265.1 hypothetical protein [Streptomyces sp. CS-7]
MGWMTRRGPEKAAREAVRSLRIPPLGSADPLGELIGVLEQRLGYSITVVRTENDSICNGALESRPGGGTAIIVPATRTPNHYRQRVCVGLARCVHRAPGRRDGRIDYSTPIEQTVEFTALLLGQYVNQVQQRGSRHGTAA